MRRELKKLRALSLTDTFTFTRSCWDAAGVEEVARVIID